MRPDRKRNAMTMVEVLIVLAIIGLLSVILIPAAKMAIEFRENSLTANRLRTAIQAFEMYRGEVGGYPPDKTPGVTPPEMVDYFEYLDIDWWGQETPIGGRWDLDNCYHFAYSVSINRPTRTWAQRVRLDKMIDDGNLSSGQFRAVDGQYHYILEE